MLDLDQIQGAAQTWYKNRNRLSVGNLWVTGRGPGTSFIRSVKVYRGPRVGPIAKQRVIVIAAGTGFDPSLCKVGRENFRLSCSMSGETGRTIREDRSDGDTMISTAGANETATGVRRDLCVGTGDTFPILSNRLCEISCTSGGPVERRNRQM